MNCANHDQHLRGGRIAIGEDRPSHVWLAIWCAILAGLGAQAQPIDIRLKASGGGTVETPCPMPYQVGQGFIAQAIPAADARFLRWEDGTTNPQRYGVLDPRHTEWIAFFETIAARPFLEEFGLDALDPNFMAQVGLVIEGGRNRLEFQLPGKVAFRVLASTNLATTPFAPVRVSSSATGNLNLEQITGTAGTTVVWAEMPEAAHTFYRIELTGGGGNLPALYLAQATTVNPGADFYVYGSGFKTGTVVVESNQGILTAQVINDQTLLVKAPSNPSSLTLRIKVGGSLVPGELTVKVSAPVADLTLGPLPKEIVVDGGLIRLTGSGFTATGTMVFIGSIPVQILAVSPSGRELAAKLPVGTLSGVVSVTQAGRLVVGQSLQVRSSLVGFTSFVPQGLHVSTWETVRPRRFGYVPFVPQGIHVSTWETATPRRFGYVAFVPNGLFVESK